MKEKSNTSNGIEVYDWTSFSSEFLEMSGYDRWYMLRESNSIREPLDVFVLKDIQESQIDNIRYELKDRLRQKLDNITNKAYVKYRDTVKNKREYPDLTRTVTVDGKDVEVVVGNQSELFDSVDKEKVDNAENELSRTIFDALETIDKDFTEYLEKYFTKLEF